MVHENRWEPNLTTTPTPRRSLPCPVQDAQDNTAVGDSVQSVTHIQAQTQTQTQLSKTCKKSAGPCLSRPRITNFHEPARVRESAHLA